MEILGLQTPTEIRLEKGDLIAYSKKEKKLYIRASGGNNVYVSSIVNLKNLEGVLVVSSADYFSRGKKKGIYPKYMRWEVYGLENNYFFLKINPEIHDIKAPIPALIAGEKTKLANKPIFITV